MIIDAEQRCNRLGIDYAAYGRAEAKLNSEIPLEKYAEVFEPDELLALIRWYNLHKQLPQYFTWDGPATGTNPLTT